MYQFTTIEALDAFLLENSFVEGFAISKFDFEILKQIKDQQIEKYANVMRWARHLATYTIAEIRAMTAVVETSACGVQKPVEEKKEEEKEEDLDLFGDDDDEEEDPEEAERKRKAREMLMAEKRAKKNGTKVKKVDKSMLVIHCKPYDDEFRGEEFLDRIRDEVQLEGLTWGARGELIDGPCQGIKIAAVACIIIDDLCSADEICEQICEKFNDQIQNAEVVVFNKYDN